VVEADEYVEPDIREREYEAEPLGETETKYLYYKR
jgi:hypothetical protein